MIPRLATVFIFLFCGTMTALLVRSVIDPENSGLAAVPSRIPFDYFAARTEGSVLDIWDGNRIIGTCEFTPQHPGKKPDMHPDRLRIRVDIDIELSQPILGSKRLDVSGNIYMQPDGGIDELELTFVLQKAVPQHQLSIHQQARKRWPAIKLERGPYVIFQSRAGDAPDPVNGMLMSAMLESAGITSESLSAKAEQAAGAATVTVRAGHIEAGGQQFDGYLLTGGSGETEYRLYMSNTGQILQVTTPMTGHNGLGLRMLADFLKPEGVRRPFK